MSTADYIVQVAEATDKSIWTGLCYYLYLGFKKSEAEEFSSDLAIAVANFVLNRKPANSAVEEFRARHLTRIEQESRKLGEDPVLCDLLSGAAYNNGYGIYVAMGGSRLFNRFLRFIREDRRDAGEDLPQKAIEPINHLRRLGLWVRREHNPNELAYLKATQIFAQRQDERVRGLEKTN